MNINPIVHLMQPLKFFALLFMATLLIGVSSELQAQQNLLSTSTGQAPSDLSLLDNPEAVRELVSRLSDSEVRELLLQQLDVVASQQTNGSDTENMSLFGLVSSTVPVSVQQAVQRFPQLVSSQSKSFTAFRNSLSDNGIIKLIGGFLMVIAIGFVVEFLVRRSSTKWRTTVNEKSPNDLSLKRTLKLLSVRLILDLSGLLAFIVITQLAIRQIIEPAGQYVAHQFLWNIVLIPRLFSVVLKFVFAPERADLRLMHTSDTSARFLHRHLVSVALLIGLTLTIRDLNQSVGMAMGESSIGFWFNLVIHLYFAYIAWHSRFTLVDILNGPDDSATPMEKKVARAYPYYAMVVIVCSWLTVEVLVGQGKFELVGKGVQYSTMFVLLLAPILDTVIRALVKHLTPAIVGDGEIARNAYNSTKRCYVRMGRMITMLLVIYFITLIWGIDTSSFSSTNIGARSITRLLEFIGVVAVGYLTWELATLWLNSKLAAEKTAAGGDAVVGTGDEGGVGGSRLSTVLPLVIWFVQTSIVVMTLLVGLGNLGVDITPLLAGAGIVGLAIGFGAQKLVGDIVSGLFFLIDDAFRAGEYVNVEGTVGTVERISLRAMQLRHHRGAIHTIPYGEIPKITNYSRDWTIMKLTFTVPFETDLKKVKNIFKKIGTDLMAIPEFADDFIQPFKSQGVIQVDDVGIVIRGKFMVKPGKQFMIRKEIFNRVQSEFDKNGIQFARKEVRVKLDNADNHHLTETDLNAIGAAASEAASGDVPS